MKRAIAIPALLVVTFSAFALAQSKNSEQMPPPKPSTPAFDAIKALAGEWVGKSDSGMEVRTSYRVVSNGSAVMNILADPGDPHEMITMFHADGPDLMVTHYCAIGNQPRMVAKAPTDTKSIAFKFKDATNVGSEGRMEALTLTMPDADHHTQEWTFRQGDKETREIFRFTRKR